MTITTSRLLLKTSNIAVALLEEFEREHPTTRRFLERVPHETLMWKPHAKAMTTGQLAYHIAEVPPATLKFSLVDESEAPNFGADRTQPRTIKEVLDLFDRGVREVREILPTIDDDRMHHTFNVVQSGRPVMSMSRGNFLRYVMFNHLYHHRGQLGTYLRLLGAKVPSSYGPSADESPFS